MPWQIVPMLREYCEELFIIIPYRAHSAATLTALGGDKIIMGKKGELGPVDASIGTHFNPPDPYKESEGRKVPLGIGVEDVMSYLSLIKEKVGIRNKKQITTIFNLLSEKVGPLALGNLNRFHSHTILLVEKLLKTHRTVLPKKKINYIVSNLTEKIFFHGHVIARREAKDDIGLRVEYPSKNLEKLIWDLYIEYERDMKLKEAFEPEIILSNDNSEEVEIGGLVAAYIESIEKTNVCKLDLRLNRIRKMPTTINFNINIGLPPNLDPSAIPDGFVQQLQQQIQQLVTNEIKRQAPIVGIQSKKIGGGWQEEN